jgi:hypothetical protein
LEHPRTLVEVADQAQQAIERARVRASSARLRRHRADIVAALAEGADTGTATMADCMTEGPVTVAPDDYLIRNLITISPAHPAR